MSLISPSQDPGIVLRIRDTIAPWKDASPFERPSFDIPQLITMALVASQNPMDGKDILQWITENFGYYRQLAVESFWGNTGPYSRFAETVKFRKDLGNALRLYDLPVGILIPGGDPHGPTYTMNDGEGQIVLGNALATKSTSLASTFRFFDLPAELRNEIYGMMFQFPKSGLLFRYPGCKRAMVRSRELDDDGDFEYTWDEKQNLLLSRHITELLVSHQFHDEALPIIYSNRLCFSNQVKMGELLRKIPQAHRQHIMDISFALHPYRPEGWLRNLMLLTKLNGLRCLTIHLDEKKLFGEEDGVHDANIRSIADMPGLEVLRRLHGLENVRFVGCPVLEQMLKGEMLEPESETGSKRKAPGGTSAAAKGRGKPKRTRT